MASYIIKRGIETLKEGGIINLFRKLRKHSINYLSCPNLILQIKNIPLGENPYKLFDFVQTKKRKVITIHQKKHEIAKLLEMINKEKLKYMLEIGTCGGGSLLLFMKSANKDTSIISMDLPCGNFGGGYPKWKGSLYKTFTSKNQKLHLLRENSHKKEALMKVKKILNGEKLDFLFIDADHSYEGIKMDFEQYSPLVKKEGIIALHDIVPHGSTDVNKFWNEIKEKYKYEEFIEDSNQFAHGIGIIFNK